MVLFMSGFPGAGKTKFIEILTNKIKEKYLEDLENPKINSQEYNTVILDPKEYLPENYDDLTETSKSDWNISSWEICLEQMQTLIDDEGNKTLIVLDTSAAKVSKMRPLFSNAKKRDHLVVYAFVHSSFEDRQSRSDEDLGKFEKYYADSFKVTIPHLKKISDCFFIIKNQNDAEYLNLTGTAKVIAKIVEDTRKNHR